MLKASRRTIFTVLVFAVTTAGFPSFFIGQEPNPMSQQAPPDDNKITDALRRLAAY